ncbi:putative membrane protein [Malaciobacter halophilus]|nr:putative membrane protein [Malaciobacter halophilus]
MQEAVTTHVYAIYFFLIIILFNFYSLVTVKNFVKLGKRLKIMTPLYHLSNAVIMYTGAIVSAYAHHFSFTVILMIAASIFLLVIEIKRYKKMRVIKSTDTKLQEEFIPYAKKIYTIELSVLVAVYIISKVF